MFEFDPSHKSYDRIFSPPQENGEQITGKGNKVLTTNYLTVEIQSQLLEGLITYSLNQQIFKFKATTGDKEPPKTYNPNKLTNLELWGVNVDF